MRTFAPVVAIERSTSTFSGGAAAVAFDRAAAAQHQVGVVLLCRAGHQRGELVMVLERSDGIEIGRLLTLALGDDGQAVVAGLREEGLKTLPAPCFPAWSLKRPARR